MAGVWVYIVDGGKLSGINSIGNGIKFLFNVRFGLRLRTRKVKEDREGFE